MHGAANLDNRRFPEPEKFDPDRDYTRHLTFGWGVHRCVGAHLAQLELSILAEVMVKSCQFALIGEPELGAPTASGNFVGFDRLMIKAETLVNA
ncbi:MAG: cytochrome P450 [Actinomycetota bacterium]|nr:cytochrome P450 [Actinomycetota bacterium]